MKTADYPRKDSVIPIKSRFTSNSVRPQTASSYDSDEDSVRLTRDQHLCIQHLGMAAAFFLPIALIAGGIAIATNYWFNVSGDHVGLFKYCNNWTQLCGGMSEKYGNNTTMELVWKIGMPLEVGGASLLFIGLLTLVCYPCHRKVNFSKIACAVVIGIFILLGCLAYLGGTIAFTIYYFDDKPDMEWSFIVSLVSAGFALLATILFWVHLFYTGCFD